MDVFAIEDSLINEHDSTLIVMDDIGIKLLLSLGIFYDANLFIVKEELLRKPLFFYMKRGHTYEKFIRHFITIQRSYGLTGKDINTETLKEKLLLNDAKPLSIQHFHSLFILMFIVVLLAFVVLILELYFRKHSKLTIIRKRFK